MPDYESTTPISSSPQTVYEALTSEVGIRSWWTESSEVGTKVGEQILVTFGNTHKIMEIQVLRPIEEVRWHVIDAKLDVPGLTRTDEWVGTTIKLVIVPLSNSTTELRLQHIGLTPAIECYKICSAGWNQFIQSLKNYCETGKGSPFSLTAI